MIEMKHINLSFRDKDLFTDQEIKIDSGKITLITGESGSGKSTLLFELARLTDYANKEYIYENEKMSDLDEESFRRKIAFVFQDCRLFNDLSVIQNIEFFSQLGQVEFKKDKMMNLLDELDLNIDYVYRVPHFVQPGETIPSYGREIFAGGKGLNQSIALARAGL